MESLLPSCGALASPTMCRFSPALSVLLFPGVNSACSPFSEDWGLKGVTYGTFTNALWGYVVFWNSRVAIGAAAIWNAQWRILRGITIGIHGGPRV